jgi:hypothetical protein
MGWLLSMGREMGWDKINQSQKNKSPARRQGFQNEIERVV